MSGNDSHADRIRQALDRWADYAMRMKDARLYVKACQSLDALVAERDRFEVALMIACADAVGPEIGCDKMQAEYDRLLALAAEREA